MDIKAPTFPESISEGTVAVWHKRPGEPVSRDDLLVDIETDKVVLEVPAPADGVLQEIVEADGQTVTADQVLAILGEGAGAVPATPQPAVKAEAPAAEKSNGGGAAAAAMGPAARKLISEHGLDASQITGSGKGGRITKDDVIQHMESAAAPAAEPAPVTAPTPAPAPAPTCPCWPTA